MTRTRWIAAAGLLVAAVVSYLFLRRDDATPARSAAAAAAVRSGALPSAPAGAAASDRPRLPPPDRATTPPPRADREAQVVDHRTGDGGTELPAIHRPSDAPPGVAPAVVGALHERGKEAARACTKAVPTDAYPVGAEVTARLRTAVQDGVLRVDDVKVEAPQVAPAAVEALVACVQAGLTGLSVDAPGEGTRDSVPLTLSYVIR